MRYIKFTCTNGFAGCDEEFWESYEDSVTDAEIDEDAEDILYGQYGFCEPDSRFLDVDEDDEDYEEACEAYHDNLDIWWEEVSKEEFTENN